MFIELRSLTPHRCGTVSGTGWSLLAPSDEHVGQREILADTRGQERQWTASFPGKARAVVCVLAGGAFGLVGGLADDLPRFPCTWQFLAMCCCRRSGEKGVAEGGAFGDVFRREYSSAASACMDPNKTPRAAFQSCRKRAAGCSCETTQRRLDRENAESTGCGTLGSEQ